MDIQKHKLNELCHETRNLIMSISGSFKKIQSASMAAIVNASRLNQNYKVIRKETDKILESCGNVEEKIQTLTCDVGGKDDQPDGRKHKK